MLFALTLCCGGDGSTTRDLMVHGDTSSRVDCGPPPLPESDCSKVTEFTAGIDTVKCEGKTLIATYHHAATCPSSSDTGIPKTYTCSYPCKTQCKIPFYGCVDPLNGKALIADICK